MYGLSEFNFSTLPQWFQVSDPKIDTEVIMINGPLNEQEKNARKLKDANICHPFGPTRLLVLSFP